MRGVWYPPLLVIAAIFSCYGRTYPHRRWSHCLSTDSEDGTLGSAVESGEGGYTPILIQPSSLTGARTVSSQKFVNFDLVAAEDPPFPSSIQVKIIEFSYPDPTFHRAIGWMWDWE